MNTIKNSGFFRIVSSILIITFISLDIAYASEANSFKLAAPSSFSNLKGAEFKEAAQIQVGIRMALKDLASLDLSSLSTLGRRQFAERTVFVKKISGTIYFDEAKACEINGQERYAESGTYLVRAQTANGAKYHCLISKKNKWKDYDVSVVPERIFAETLKKGTVKFTHGSVSQKDKAIIDLYTEHEISTENNVAIDEWIRQRMERGEYAVLPLYAGNPLYKNGKLISTMAYLDGPCKEAEAYLKALGLSGDSVSRLTAHLVDKPVVFIPHDGRGSLPYITMPATSDHSQKVSVTAHSSEFATYFFVSRDSYEWMLKASGDWGKLENTFMARQIVHEIGARCGLKTKVDTKTLRASNILDEYFDIYVNANRPEKLEVPDAVSAKLENLSPVNLLELELRNDYAAGEAEKRGIFKRCLAVIITGAIAMGGYMYNKSTSEKPASITETEKPASIAKTEKPVVVHKYSESEITELIGKLNGRDINAIKILGEIGDKRAIEPLILMLNDKDGDIRMCVAKALCKIGDKEAVPALSKILVEGEFWVVDSMPESTQEEKYAKKEAQKLSGDDFRIEIAKALGKIGDKRAIPALEKTLNEQSCDVCTAAVYALGEIGGEESAEALVRQHVLRHQPRYGVHWGIHDDARIVLSKIGKPAVKPLIDALNNPNFSYELERYHIADTLGLIDDKSAVEPLIQLLEDKDEQRPEGNSSAKLAAAQALGKFKDPRAVGALIKTLSTHEDAVVRSVAAESLGEIGDTRAIDALTKALDDEDFVRQRAAEALDKFKNKPVNQDQLIPYYIAKHNWDELVKMGSPAVESIIKTLSDEPYWVRSSAAIALGEIKDPKAVEPLIKALSDSDDGVRAWSAAALGEIKDSRAVEPLIRTLSDKREAGRRIAAEALDKFNWKPKTSQEQIAYDIATQNWQNLIKTGQPAVEPIIKAAELFDKSYNKSAIEALVKIGQPAVEPLIKALNDKDIEDLFVREALRKIGQPAVEPLIKFLNDKNPKVCVFVAEILGDLRDARAAGPLINALSDNDRDIRTSAAQALGKIEDLKAVEPLIKALSDNDWYVRTRAAGALGNIKDLRAVQALIKVASSNYEAANALVKIGQPAVEPLINALNDENNNVREYVAEALGEIKKAEAIKPLINALSDKENDVRYRAAKALDKFTWKPNSAQEEIAYCIATHNLQKLIKIGQPAVESLIKILSDDNKDVKQMASQALGEIKDLRAIEPLTGLLKDKDSWVQFYAREAIEKIQKAPEGERNNRETPKKEEPKKSSMLNVPAAPQAAQTAKDQMGTTIPHLNEMRFGQMWRVEEITNVLWDASVGATTTAKAKGELAKLAPEVGKVAVEREAVYDDWLKKAAMVVAVLAVPRTTKYGKSSDEDIRLIASRIKEAGIEVFIPKFQFPGNAISRYRGIIESMGGKLRVYQHVENLQAMIKNPAKSIVMAVDISGKDAELLQALKATAGGLRFMNFAKMDDLDKMASDELDNYEADILSILLVARIITPEDFQDKGNPTYRMLSHLLEDYMPDGASVENYIQDIVTNAARLIKTILKALPMAAYKAMRQSVEVLWSA